MLDQRRLRACAGVRIKGAKQIEISGRRDAEEHAPSLVSAKFVRTVEPSVGRLDKPSHGSGSIGTTRERPQHADVMAPIHLEYHADAGRAACGRYAIKVAITRFQQRSVRLTAMGSVKVEQHLEISRSADPEDGAQTLRT